MDSSRIDEICDMLAEGKSLRAICRQLDLKESSVRYWLTKDEDAFAQSVRARELGCDSLADECIDIADDDTIKADERRVRIDTRVRLIGKWSQRYGDKQMHEHSGPGGAPIETIQRVERVITDPSNPDS